MDYTDPKTGKLYRRLPVRQGPESVALEQIRLPFWYSGPQYERARLGLRPLRPLAAGRGDRRHLLRHPDGRQPADRSTRPGCASTAPTGSARPSIEAAVGRNPLRSAVIAAAQITQQNLPGQPSLRFPAAGTREFKEAMETQPGDRRPGHLHRRRGPGADHGRLGLPRPRDLPALAGALRSDQGPAAGDQDPLLRVQLGLRPDEGRPARASRNPKSNAWRLEPDAEIHYSPAAQRAGEEATGLLERVVTEHRGTPWALLAQRELKDPFGFKWVETYVPPAAAPERRAATTSRSRTSTRRTAKPPRPRSCDRSRPVPSPNRDSRTRSADGPDPLGTGPNRRGRTPDDRPMTARSGRGPPHGPRRRRLRPRHARGTA